MSLEFALQYACPLRANYSERHLREWGRLSSLHAKLTTGDASAPLFDFALSVERISVTILGMRTPEHVATNLQHYAARALSNEEKRELLAR